MSLGGYVRNKAINHHQGNDEKNERKRNLQRLPGDRKAWPALIRAASASPHCPPYKTRISAETISNGKRHRHRK